MFYFNFIAPANPYGTTGNISRGRRFCEKVWNNDARLFATRQRQMTFEINPAITIADTADSEGSNNNFYTTI